MTSNALVPFVPQGIAVRPLPQLYAAGGHEPVWDVEPSSLVTHDTWTPDQNTDLFLLGEQGGFSPRTFKYTYIPPPVGRNWRGYVQEPSSIRSNLRFSGTYDMEGTFLSNVTEKGSYIDFFS